MVNQVKKNLFHNALQPGFELPQIVKSCENLFHSDLQPSFELHLKSNQVLIRLKVENNFKIYFIVLCNEIWRLVIVKNHVKISFISALQPSFDPP